MSREILFKAKRLDNNAWVTGYYIYHIKRTLCPFGDRLRPEDKQHAIMKDGFSDWNMPRNTVHYDIDPSTLCQFTGLLDIDGRRIWENDIIECKSDKYHFQSQVEWDNKCAGFIIQDSEHSAVGLDAITKNGIYKNVRVISNIFDEGKDELEKGD